MFKLELKYIPSLVWCLKSVITLVPEERKTFSRISVPISAGKSLCHPAPLEMRSWLSWQCSLFPRFSTLFSLQSLSSFLLPPNIGLHFPFFFPSNSHFISKFYTFFHSFTLYFLVFHFLSFPFYFQVLHFISKISHFYFQGSFSLSSFPPSFPNFSTLSLSFLLPFQDFSLHFPIFPLDFQFFFARESPGETLGLFCTAMGGGEEEFKVRHRVQDKESW